MNGSPTHAQDTSTMSKFLKLAHKFNSFYLNGTFFYVIFLMAARECTVFGWFCALILYTRRLLFYFFLRLEHSLTNNNYPLCENSGLQKKECYAFIVDGIQVGLVRATVTTELRRYPNVFIINPNSVTLNPAFRNYDERSANIESVLKDMKDKQLFVTLKGWRDEVYKPFSFFIF